MIAENPSQLILRANILLNKTKTSAVGIQSDVAAHQICYNSRVSIMNYLASFLMMNGVSIPIPTTLSSIYKACKDLDSRFEALDISAIACRFETHNKDYCVDVDTVERCLEVAKQLQIIVQQEDFILS